MKRAMPYLLVTLQFVFLAALVIVPFGGLWARSIPVVAVAALAVVGGLAVVTAGVLGLGSALTASPVPKPGATLVTTGIYRTVRHPIYTGLLLAGLGLIALGASILHLALWLGLLALLGAKARWEERMLAAAHPEYLEYGKRSGRLLPGIGRLR